MKSKKKNHNDQSIFKTVLIVRTSKAQSVTSGVKICLYMGSVVERNFIYENIVEENFSIRIFLWLRVYHAVVSQIFFY